MQFRAMQAYDLGLWHKNSMTVNHLARHLTATSTAIAIAPWRQDEISFNHSRYSAAAGGCNKGPRAQHEFDSFGLRIDHHIVTALAITPYTTF